MSSWFRVFAVIVPVLTLALLLAACFGADNGDDVDATATQPAAAATTTSVQIPPTATVTTVPPTATSTATIAPPVTATSAPPATATTVPATATTAPPAATATATAIPLPSGGAELDILGKSIERIVPGDAAGTLLYAITSGGISRSNDSGVTWVASGSVQEGQLVAALNNPDVLY